MPRTQSLPWLILVSALTLALAGVSWLIFNDIIAEFFAMPDWQPAADSVESDPTVGEDVATGHRSIEAMWTAFPVIIVVSVTVHMLVKSRRTR